MTHVDLLFSGQELRAVLTDQERRLVAEVNALPAEQLLGTAVDELTRYFVAKHSVDAPALVEAEIEVSTRESQKDVSHDPRRMIPRRVSALFVPATETTYYVPFTGDAALFRCQASTFSSGPPRALVKASELNVIFIVAHDETADLNAQFDRTLQGIKQHLAWLTSDVRAFNDGLAGKAQAAITARVERLKKSQDQTANLGYPIRRRDNAPRTFAVPEVRRKAPQLTPPTGCPGTALEPALDLENYEHILSVMQNMVAVMERSPGAFRTMNEPAIRQHFLVQLNAQYEGQATGETFNYEGKTDILIRSQNRNIFIAECKFWQGPKSLDDAITQLLSYTSWRDTKTAILIFNRDRNTTTVLRAIPDVVRSRREFRRDIPYSTETGFRYALHHRDDPERELLLTILVFAIPT